MRRLAIAVAGALGLQTHLNGMSAAFRLSVPNRALTAAQRWLGGL